MDVTSRPILDMSAEEARGFFLKTESYFSHPMPAYFDFAKVLKKVDDVMSSTTTHLNNEKKPADCPDINYSLFINKDGKYGWREMKLLHPVVYVKLVHEITEPDAWTELLCRFKDFKDLESDSNPIGTITCASIPREASGRNKNSYDSEADLTAKHLNFADQRSQILTWWSEVEQKSIELSLDYDFMFTTDISNCYGSIYTHSIPWALHGKDKAKKYRRCKKLLGNRIDTAIQAMQHRQTNGIPVGSVLMDFIAELVLGYVDELLANRISNYFNNPPNHCSPKPISSSNAAPKYQIIRYRDDYRIFTNDRLFGEEILRLLNEQLQELGMQMHPMKTSTTGEIIRDAVKADKRAWLCRKQTGRNFQEKLLIIHDHALQYPQSGQLQRALQGVYHEIRVKEKLSVREIKIVLSILTDIAYRNPNIHRDYVGIYSVLLDKLFVLHGDEVYKQVSLIRSIMRKFRTIPNTEYMEIWLQRAMLNRNPEEDFEAQICKLVASMIDPKLDAASGISLWENEWLPKKSPYRAGLAHENFIDVEIIKKMSPAIPAGEFLYFAIYGRAPK